MQSSENGLSSRSSRSKPGFRFSECMKSETRTSPGFRFSVCLKRQAEEFLDKAKVKLPGL
jgi:hypothetical protein